ncbi:hypothetical protein [Blautia wexlerae]
MNKGIIYCTKIREEYEGAHMEHMIAERTWKTIPFLSSVPAL